MYKFKLTDTATGETEIVEGNWPNQRDAAKFAILHSVMANTGTDLDFIECELLEPLTLRGPGRPKLDDSDPTERIAVTLQSSLVAKLDRLAPDGNRSAWIRQAIEAA